MTDEEKQAIEYMDKIVSDCENYWKQLGYTCNLYDGDEPIPVDVYKTVLNLIKKQQAEIEQLQKKLSKHTIQLVSSNWKQMHKHNEDLEMLYKGCQIELEEKDKYIEKLENKLMYALSPSTHELALNTQENFKKIIRDNLEEDTYTIKRALKEYWEDK